MPASIVQFSVCLRFVLNRRDIKRFLQQSLVGVRILSIDLDDHIFTMTVWCSKYKAQTIVDKIAERGFFIREIAVNEKG